MQAGTEVPLSCFWHASPWQTARTALWRSSASGSARLWPAAGSSAAAGTDSADRKEESTSAMALHHHHRWSTWSRRCAVCEAKAVKVNGGDWRWASPPAPRLAGLRSPTAAALTTPAGNTAASSSACKHSRNDFQSCSYRITGWPLWHQFEDELMKFSNSAVFTQARDQQLSCSVLTELMFILAEARTLCRKPSVTGHTRPLPLQSCQQAPLFKSETTTHRESEAKAFLFMLCRRHFFTGRAHRLAFITQTFSEKQKS